MNHPTPTPWQLANPAFEGLRRDQSTPHATIQTLLGVVADTTASMERGPLIDQPAPAARLAQILNNAAQELWDACTLQDAAQMSGDARAIASRILAACPKG